VAHKAVWDYCDKHNLKRPNRCTTVQPAGTKSLLTGASPGWHPPKAQRFIRRITFAKNDPVALACIDYGYNVIPSQSDKDSEGNLLNDPYSELCTEWLIEIPTKTVWADLPGVDKAEIDISKFSAKAQFDFYMQVQTHYTTHNTSATIELRQEEVEEYSELVYDNIQDGGGYMSAALLARFDEHETYPRPPFGPISKDEYKKLHEEVLKRRKPGTFDELLQARLNFVNLPDVGEVGPAGCDSDACLFPLKN
jgi:ribonucleotide reductase class II